MEQHHVGPHVGPRKARSPRSNGPRVAFRSKAPITPDSGPRGAQAVGGAFHLTVELPNTSGEIRPISHQRKGTPVDLQEKRFRHEKVSINIYIYLQ